MKTNELTWAALDLVIQEAIKPLMERIAALEGVDHERSHALNARYIGGAYEKIMSLETRVTALENPSEAQGTNDRSGVD